MDNDVFISEYANKPVFYIYDLDGEYYKYGYAKDILERDKQHRGKKALKDLSMKLIHLEECSCQDIARDVEKTIKDEANVRRESMSHYNETEIIKTANISLYINLAQKARLRLEVERLEKPVLTGEMLKTQHDILLEQIKRQKEEFKLERAREKIKLVQLLAQIDREKLAHIAQIASAGEILSIGSVTNVANVANMANVANSAVNTINNVGEVSIGEINIVGENNGEINNTISVAKTESPLATFVGQNSPQDQTLGKYLKMAQKSLKDQNITDIAIKEYVGKIYNNIVFKKHGNGGKWIKK